MTLNTMSPPVIALCFLATMHISSNTFYTLVVCCVCVLSIVGPFTAIYYVCSYILCVHVCVHVHACVCVCMCACMCVHVFACVCVCVCVCVAFVCVCCMCVCAVCVCVHVCVCVCVCVCVHICVSRPSSKTTGGVPLCWCNLIIRDLRGIYSLLVAEAIMDRQEWRA